MASTYYKCNKCSRITTSYPLGCHRSDCPVKRDWYSDVFSGIIFVVFILGGYFYYLAHIGKPH